MSARHLAAASGLTEQAAAEVLRQLAADGYELRRKSAPKRGSEPPGLRYATDLHKAHKAVLAEHGPRWYLVPGASQYIEVPRGMRTYRFTRKDGSQSIKITNRRDCRVPAPRYWPNGRLPDGAIIA